MSNIKKHNYKYVYFIFSLLFFQILIYGITTKNVQAMEGTSIFYEIDGNTKVGNEFDINIKASNITNLYGLSVDWVYDDSILDIINVSLSNELKSQYSLKEHINKIEKGKVSLAFSLMGNGQAINEDECSLITLRVKAKKQGFINLNTTNINENLILDKNNIRIKLADINSTAINYKKNNKQVVITDNGMAPLEKGYYEENDNRIVRDGSWNNWNSVAASGGTMISSNDKGDILEFNFIGSGFRVLGLTNYEKGIAKVTVDDRTENLIDCFSQNSIYKNTIIERNGLEYGVHNVKVQVTGAKNSKASYSYVNIDSIEILGDNYGNKSLIQESNPNIIYKGSWKNWLNENHSGGSAKYSNVKGDSLEYKFKGTNIKILGYTNEGRGRAKLTIDGREFYIDNYTSKSIAQNVLFETSNLTNTDHILKLEVIGEKDPNSNNTTICIDAFEVESIAEVGMYQEDSNFIKYTGSWTKWSNSNHSGGNTIYSNDINSSIQFSFYGTGLRMLSYTNNQKGIVKVVIDNKYERYVDTYSNIGNYKDVVYEVTNLQEGLHTIEVRLTGLKNNLATDTYLNFDGFEVLNSKLDLVTVEEKGNSVVYNGSWRDWLNSEHSGGSAKYSNTKGDNIEYRFKGTSIKVLGYTNEGRGRARLTIDDKEYYIDNYTSKSMAQNVLFEVSNLSNTEHLLKLEVLGEKNSLATNSTICIDAFQVNTIIDSGLYEETSDFIRYTGNWTRWDNINHSGGSTIYSNDKNASIEFTFYGTGIRMLSYKNHQKGIVKVTVDNTNERYVDTYSNISSYKDTVYELKDLKEGFHTIKVSVTGMKNSLSSDTYLNFDGFEVLNDKSNLTSVQENNASIVYRGSWKNWLNENHSGGSAKYSNVKGDSLEYKFKGTGVKVVGYTNEGRGRARLTIDGKQYYIDSYTSKSMPQNVLFQISNLSNAEHTLKMEILGEKDEAATDTTLCIDAFQVFN